ncbi:MAG: ribonuclease J [bacterium]|nr:ribonuclease J [bacterium]
MIRAPKREFRKKVATDEPRSPRNETAGQERGYRSHHSAPISHARTAFVEPRADEHEYKNDAILRFCPLGGFEEIGRNCAFFEYKNEIVIIDMGIQFPQEETPGIDFIIPNIQYLESKKKNIKAILLTHGHYDHIGAIPYVIEKLGNPMIYTTLLTKEIVSKRQGDFPNMPKLKLNVVTNRDVVKLGEYFTAEFFGVAHTIPDTTGIILKTPVGNVVTCADFRIDYDNENSPLGLDEFKRVGAMGIHTLMLDSTNAEEHGRSLSERVVEKNLEDLINKSAGRIIIGLFASLITRIAEIIKIAERLDKKVIIIGRSMKDNVGICQKLGYIKAAKNVLIPVEEMHKYKDDKIIILTTGAQGQANAGFMRIAHGEHPHVRIKKTDTILFSSSVIPGNERSVQVLKDHLARQAGKVYTSSLIDIHSSGHAPEAELKEVISLIKPKFLVPTHGHYFMRAVNSEHGQSVGMPKENIMLPDNGTVAELTESSFVITKESVPSNYVMVDGLGVGDVEEVVLRDRLALAAEGMVVIILTMDRATGRLLKTPDIISRGFIYLKENKEMLDLIRLKIKGLVTRIPRTKDLEPDYVKGVIRDQIGQLLYNKTKRRPMVLPVLIEI